MIFESLRVRLHRIGRSHWRAASVLRSWGAVPLHQDGDALHVPCADDEALWLGAWLDDDESVTASVALNNPASGRSTFVRVADRGPVSRAYLVELSAAAATALDLDPNAARRVELRLLP